MRQLYLLALITPALLLPAGATDLPKPVLQDATEAVRDATPLNTSLAPAPTVTKWGPVGGNVDHGLITIEGSGFDPAKVRVTHKGTSLTLVEKSATKVVARLGDWSGGSAFEGVLAVGSVGGQSRVLAEKYQILPRWPSAAPRFVEAERLSSPQYVPGLIPFSGTSYAPYRLRFLGVPGDEVVGEYLNNTESTDGYCISNTYGDSWKMRDSAASGSVRTYNNHPQPNYPVPIQDDPQTLESGRRGAQELHVLWVRLRTSLVNGGANCKGRLRLQVRYRDEPDDVREVLLVMPGIASPSARRILVVNSTQEFVDSRLVTVKADSRNTPAVCGSEEYEGDFRQSLRDVPAVGSDCKFAFIEQAANWREGYELLAYNWSGPSPPTASSSSRPRCFIATRDFSNSFGEGEMAGQMGWKRLEFGYFPAAATPNVRLECRGNLDSPTTVRARLNSVEIFAPASATSWRNAIK